VGVLPLNVLETQRSFEKRVVLKSTTDSVSLLGMGLQSAMGKNIVLKVETELSPRKRAQRHMSYNQSEAGMSLSPSQKKVTAKTVPGNHLGCRGGSP
jgi:hypothetical protein